MTTRVMHILPDLVPYGLERMVASLATRADRSRFEVSVVSLYGQLPGSLTPDLESEGIRVFHLDKRRGLDLRMFHRLSRVMGQVEPGIVHTHNYVLRYVLPPALWHRVPLVVHTIHNAADREVDGFGVRLQKPLFERGMVHPVVIAEDGALSYERTYGLPRPPLIRNGIAVERYSAGERRRWREQNGFGESDLLFACVARFMPQKNHRTLIEAFARRAGQMAGAKLLLAGDGYLQPDLERQAADAGVGEKIRFLGRREDIPELLAASDVFVLASLWEGNPLSVMEAMAAGLPSVVTSVGGVPELVRNNEEGYVVAPGDSGAFGEAMLALAGDEARRREMGRAAGRRAKTEFSEERMVRSYEALYARLMAREGKAGYCAVN